MFLQKSQTHQLSSSAPHLLHLWRCMSEKEGKYIRSHCGSGNPWNQSPSQNKWWHKNQLESKLQCVWCPCSLHIEFSVMNIYQQSFMHVENTELNKPHSNKGLLCKVPLSPWQLCRPPKSIPDIEQRGKQPTPTTHWPPNTLKTQFHSGSVPTP